MNGKKTAVLVVVGMLGVATSAFGAAGSFTFGNPPVIALSDTVTYRIEATTGVPALETYVGLRVGEVKNTGGNTINGISITLSAGVTDSAEKLTLFRPEIYLPSACTWAKDSAGNPVPANPVVITCTVRQMQNGESFPAFDVFFRAPVKVDGNTVGDAPNSDFVSTNLRVVYAEGTNDPSSVPPNSIVDNPQPNLIALGTSNPTNIRSALPKSGGKFYTGNNAVPSVATFPFATALTVPLATVVTSTEINLKKVVDNDGVQLCVAAGNFNNCYASAITIAGLNLDGVIDPATNAQAILTIVLRIDQSEVKSPFKPQNVHVFHDGAELFACQSGQPNTSVPHCVAGIFRYSGASSNGELKQDVEAVIWGLTNGSFTIR